MNYDILSTDSNKPFGSTVADLVTSCNTCSKYIKEICLTLEPAGSNWFRQCVLEIDQHDGHVILERFLRIYRAFNPSRYAKDLET
jgi:hypothetical protein